MESGEVCADFMACQDMDKRNIDPTTCTMMPQWVEMWRVYQSNEIRGVYKKAEDDVNGGLPRMRSLAIWEARETMERWVSERDNSLTFLA
jgi:hypothetical protein